MKFVIVDLETTGQAPEINEIIEIGAVLVEKKNSKLKVTKKMQSLLRPYGEIPPVITTITGIDDSMVEKAPRFQDVAEKFLKFLGDAVFVAHNAVFDLRMLNIALKRYAFAEITNPVIDTQDLLSIAYPTITSHRLADVIEVLNIKVKDRHRALADAEATAKVLIDTLCKIKKLPLEILYQMNRLLNGIDDPLAEIFGGFQREKLVRADPAELSEVADWKKHLLVKEKFRKSKYLPKEDPEPLALEKIEEYFGPEGLLKEIFPAYECREQQTAMAKTILRCFNEQQHALVEAGTGTGKTMAYLLPALLWIKENGGPIVVSTRTKNLQDQLINKDLPAIERLFNKAKFQYTVLKGRPNYVCLRRVELLFQQYKKNQTRNILPALGLLTWLTETKDGDLSELHSSLEKRFGRGIHSDYYSCDNEKCGNYRTCFLQHIRRQARYSDLVIANHALVLTELSGSASLLPPYQRIILDEAHTMEDAVTEAFSVSLSLSPFLDELKSIEHLGGQKEKLKLSEFLRNDIREFFEFLSGLETRGPEETKLLLGELAKNDEVWTALNLSLSALQKNFKKYFSKLEEADQKTEEDSENKLSELKAAVKALEEKWNTLQKVFNGCENFTAWLRFSRAKPPYNVFAEMAPIDIGDIVQKSLFIQKESVIMASATLTVNKNFNYFKQRFGITPDIEDNFSFLALGSPFNYREKMLLALPDDLSTISVENTSVVSIAEYLFNLFEIFSGRTMVLFTSYRLMEKVYSIVRPLAQDIGISVLCQGTHGSRNALLSRFKSTAKTVLFGTSSFWEGVDVAGDMLSCVVIVKLPFAVPTERSMPSVPHFWRNKA
jgi:predicted DnaQ family exonuclease/DinG family helicase